MPETTRERPFVVRPFNVEVDGVWIGNGVSYGPHRDGQRPGGESPTEAQLQEDLRLLRRYWRLLRLYNAVGPAEEILRLIREEDLGIKVMLGAWIAPERDKSVDGIEKPDPEAVAANRLEVREAIRLANKFPDVVSAINVGNETQIYWSAHTVETATVIEYVRQVRQATTVPVTTADDFNYWNKPESRALADELDFLVVHAYAMWNSQTLDESVTFTEQKLEEVRAVHPDRLLVLGETGWATQKHSEGEQAKLIVAPAGETQQGVFLARFRAWTAENRVVNFYFEAFDENWKGGPHPDEVEKHWGLFRADRTPKPAVAALPRAD